MPIPKEKKARVGRPPSCECGVCRKCKNRVRMREWYRSKTPDERRGWIARRDRELARQRDRDRYQRDKEKRLALLASRDEKKRKARAMVNIRVERGTMYKPDTCERCGAGGRIEGHHHDYDKPLEVEWLCEACHGIEHRKADHEFVGWEHLARPTRRSVMNDERGIQANRGGARS